MVSVEIQRRALAEPPEVPLPSKFRANRRESAARPAFPTERSSERALHAIAPRAGGGGLALHAAGVALGHTLRAIKGAIR